MYLVVLLSMLIFYGLERLAKSSRKKQTTADGPDRTSAGVFWIHIGTFALLNVLIGYVLLDRAAVGPQHLLLFFLAMLFKFVVNDHGLYADQGSLSHHRTVAANSRRTSGMDH